MKVVCLIALMLAAGVLNACDAGKLGASRSANEHYRDELPFKSVEITIARGTEAQFFDALRESLDASGFAIRISPTEPTGQRKSIQIYRDDVRVLGANPFDNNIFSLGIFAGRAPDAELAAADFLAALKIATDQLPESKVVVKDETK